MQRKKISSLEYKLAQILEMDDIVESCEPRTLQEENEAANEQLRQQLSTFKNPTTGEPIFQGDKIKKLCGEKSWHLKQII